MPVAGRGRSSLSNAGMAAGSHCSTGCCSHSSTAAAPSTACAGGTGGTRLRCRRQRALPQAAGPAWRCVAVSPKATQATTTQATTTRNPCSLYCALNWPGSHNRNSAGAVTLTLPPIANRMVTPVISWCKHCVQHTCSCCLAVMACIMVHVHYACCCQGSWQHPGSSFLQPAHHCSCCRRCPAQLSALPPSAQQAR